eukprot:57211_1
MSELLIDGYIRKIEQQLSCRKGFNNIIPININNICYLFYHNPTIIYISNISKNQFDTFEQLTIHALDVSNMHNPTLNQNIFQLNNTPFRQDILDIFTYTSSYCFIPDIFGTSSLKQLLNQNNINKNDLYDALFMQPDATLPRKSLNILLFALEPFFLIFKRNQPSDFHVIKCSKAQPNSMSHLKYCDQYGVIGEKNEKIYQLKLNNIINTDFTFSQLSQRVINDINPLVRFGSSPYLATIYLGQQQTLFCIQCQSKWFGDQELLNAFGTTPFSSKCCLYDFQLNTWKSIARFNYSAYISDKNNFQCGLCTNYNVSNKLYLVSNIGHTSEYDFKKDKWYHLCKNINDGMRFSEEPIVWSSDCEPNILYCINKYKCYSFDIRVSHRKWMLCNNDTQTMCNCLGEEIIMFT